MRVCLAGTFNVLHKGHKLLIDTAINTVGKNGKLFIGIATGDLLSNKKFKVPIERRESELKKYILKKDFTNFEIIPISDKFGLAVDGSYDAIVVSSETEQTAQAINIERKRKNKSLLKIITVEYILGDDNLPINSTRILNKEIDEDGKKIKNED